MTKRQFEEMFREEVLPLLAKSERRSGFPDKPGRREAWNNTIDAYIRNRTLPESAGDWSHPRWLDTAQSKRSRDDYDDHATMKRTKMSLSRPKSPAQLQREIDETLAGKGTAQVSHATKKRPSQGRVVGRHGLGTADVRTGEGAYWIVTVPTGYRVDYKPWGPSSEVDLGTFKSRTKARAKITAHAGSVGATIVS